jgi:hypothetical protein
VAEQERMRHYGLVVLAWSCYRERMNKRMNILCPATEVV